jgi:hypothetical protein
MEASESKSVCVGCNGTGYCGPYNPPGTPPQLLKIGCWPCNFCKGSGIYYTWEKGFINKIKDSSKGV